MTYSHPRYDSGFGYPFARALGIGYIQEMVARLTHTPIETHNSSTNSTLDDNPITFPLDHNLYVDATHEVVVLNSEFESLHYPLILSKLPLQLLPLSIYRVSRRMGLYPPITFRNTGHSVCQNLPHSRQMSSSNVSLIVVRRYSRELKIRSAFLSLAGERADSRRN